MKKEIKTKLLFIALGSVLLTAAYSQDEKIFPEGDAIWNIQGYVTYGNFSPKEGCREFIGQSYYGLTGDTIINDILYNKLYQLNDTLLVIDENDRYMGGFRQENKQVWFRPYEREEECNPEFLVYDFSKEERDVVEILDAPTVYGFDYFYFGGCWDYYGTISRIEETKWGKSFTVDESTWIEGIGNLEGLFSHFEAIPLDGNHYEDKLACMKVGDEWFYLMEGSNSCFCYHEPDYNNISTIKNNPVTVKLNKSKETIEISSDILNGLSFELINLQGQTVKSRMIQSSGQNIDYADLSSGIYLYRIMQEGKVIQTGKLII